MAARANEGVVSMRIPQRGVTAMKNDPGIEISPCTILKAGLATIVAGLADQLPAQRKIAPSVVR